MLGAMVGEAGPPLRQESPKEGVVIHSKTIEANGRTFSLLESSVMKEGEKDISCDRLNQILKEVAYVSGLHGEPKTLVVIKKDGDSIHADISYYNKEGANGARVAKINGCRSGTLLPDLDVLLTRLTISTDPGEIAPVLVIDPSLDLRPYGRNKLGDNPYKGLERFAGKVYDGSLKFSELDKFIGFRFGNDQWSYVYGATHRGQNFMVTGFLNKLPNIGDKLEEYDSDWEILEIAHNRFDATSTEKPDSTVCREFIQHITFALKHLEFHPPLSPSKRKQKIIENDRLFWAKMAYSTGFELKEIEPQYTDKDPVTPWYEATHTSSGQKLFVGTRFRVYSISENLGGNGSHIPRGEPEKVKQYLSEWAEKSKPNDSLTPVFK